jgi:sn-glycerol 3-phosphate transport system permease protein
MKHPLRLALVCAAALLWLIPFAWMAVASFRPEVSGAQDLASLLPAGPFDFSNYREAWSSGDFPLWYLNTFFVCVGILAVQCVTVSLAGYAFARLRFRYRGFLFVLFLLQILLPPAVLVVPNLEMVTRIGLYDTLPGRN